MYIFFFFLLSKDNVGTSRKRFVTFFATNVDARAREISTNETQLIIGKSGLPARGGSDRGVLFLRVIN